MKKILFTIFLLTSFGMFAQNLSKEDINKELEPLLSRIKTLEEKNAKLNSEVRVLKAELSDFASKSDSLKNQTQTNNDAINQVAEELGLKAAEKTTSQKISELENSLDNISLWAIIGILLAIVIPYIVYWLLSKKRQSDKADMMKQLNEAKSSIETNVTKLLNNSESSTKADVTEQLNKAESSIKADVKTQLNKTDSLIKENVTEQLNKIKTDVTEQLDKIKADVTKKPSSKKKTS